MLSPGCQWRTQGRGSAAQAVDGAPVAHAGPAVLGHSTDARVRCAAGPAAPAAAPAAAAPPEPSAGVYSDAVCALAAAAAAAAAGPATLAAGLAWLDQVLEADRAVPVLASPRHMTHVPCWAGLATCRVLLCPTLPGDPWRVCTRRL